MLFSWFQLFIFICICYRSKNKIIIKSSLLRKNPGYLHELCKIWKQNPSQHYCMVHHAKRSEQKLQPLQTRSYVRIVTHDGSFGVVRLVIRLLTDTHYTYTIQTHRSDSPTNCDNRNNRVEIYYSHQNNLTPIHMKPNTNPEKY